MHTSTSNAKYFFIELGIIASLYISVISFITFAFDVINYMFPDRLAYSFDPYSSSIRFAISTLIIVFPLFVTLSYFMWKLLLADVAARSFSIRKWLSYLTLFVAGSAVAGDLVTLVYTFLNGEISSRFVLKIAVVLLVAFGVFLYSLKDLKGTFYEKPKLFKISMFAASAVVLVGLIAGFTIIGAPASQRDLRDDQTRSSNLQSIQWEVINFYQRTGKLPASATDLVDPLYPNNVEFYKDPASGAPYEYRTIASSTPVFELCADFALASRTEDLKGRGGYGGESPSYPVGFSSKYSYVDYYPNYGDAFEHTEGHNCFTRIVDPSRYPVTKPGTMGVPEPMMVQ